MERVRSTIAAHQAQHVSRCVLDRVPPDPTATIAEAKSVLATITRFPGYAETPLRELALSKELGIGRVFYKDESARFGLGSFKAMGAAYALLGEVARMHALAKRPDFALAKRLLASTSAQLTVACATDGNHGRAVAWAANLLNIGCVIFLPRAVSEARAAAISAFGAETRRVDGNYDDAVLQAETQARQHGWRIISDTAYGDYEEVPRDIMKGYTAIGAEIHGQQADLRPTHVVAQAGVGGFAASMFSYFAALAPLDPPVNLVVEPLSAACLFASAQAGTRTTVRGALDTIMAGLACGEPSTLAWKQISALNCHFLAIADQSAAAAMRLLAEPAVADPPIIAGESGAAGLAGLLCVAMRPELRAALDLTSRSRVLLVGTEGATDPISYERIIESGSGKHGRS